MSTWHPTSPDQCRFVLETLAAVYKNDAHCKQQRSSAEERLLFHQTHSGPLMTTLQDWLAEQLDQHLVEPNSGLGQAISYMRKHWPELTLFLRQAEAPLDNNIAHAAGGMSDVMPTAGICRVGGSGGVPVRTSMVGDAA